MKKILFFLLFASCFVSGQTAMTRIDTIIANREQIRIKNLELAETLGAYKNVFEDLDKVIHAFNKTKRDLLAIEDLNNKQLQKALVQPLANQYLSFFILKTEDSTANVLKYGYTNRDDLERELKLAQAVMLGNIIEKENEIIDSRLEEIEAYVNKNLKRLGITRESWDKMSDNDQELLRKSFN